MGTLDSHLLPDDAPGLGAPPAAPPPEPERVPTAPAELEPEPDQLPRSGSACRYCGMRAAADAMRVGGTFRLPADIAPPADATEVRRVRVSLGAVDWERAASARRAGDMEAYGRARSGRVVQEVATPTWRVCSACEALGDVPEPLALLFAALGRPSPHVRTPVNEYVAERHQVRPYHEAGQPADRGSRDPWQHATAELLAAAAELAELNQAGGVPAPIGPGCGICGRSHSPYGWRATAWRPPGTASETPEKVALCDGWVFVPADRTHRRFGCERLLEQPEYAGPLADRVLRRAAADGVDVPPRIGALERVFAWRHPNFWRAVGPRAAWWHVADIPPPMPTPEEELAERLAELEARLAEATR